MKICATIKVVKYIYKYVYKDCDQTTLEITKNDEITRHLNDRYIGPTQAVWELFEFSTHEEYSSVHHLPVHLFEQQVIYFESDLSLEELQNRLNFSTSELLSYFDYNRQNANGRSYVYQDFSNHYVWKQKKKR